MVLVGLFIYILISFGLGGLLIAIAVEPSIASDTQAFLATIEYTSSMRLFVGALGVLLILFCIKLLKERRAQAQREKTIAFRNAQGEVTISLMALEDMVRKQIAEYRQIRDARPYIVAGKKGIRVTLRIVLDAAANIPELTASVQENVRARLQSILGIEENIMVNINIRKIISSGPGDRSGDKSNARQGKGELPDNHTVPYRDF